MLNNEERKCLIVKQLRLKPKVKNRGSRPTIV